MAWSVERVRGCLVGGAAVLSLCCTGGTVTAQNPSESRPASPSANDSQTKLDARIAELKAKTAALVASALPPLDALSLDQRLSAPPAVWSVPGALTEFEDCADCPRMAVIPAGEFTMG